MKRFHPLVITSWIVFALFLTVLLTMIFIPADEFRGVLVRGLARQGYTVRAGYFGKAFPLGIKARNLEISDDRGGLLKLDTVSARVSLPALCIGRVVVTCRGEIGKGSVEGRFSRGRNSRFSLKLDNVPMEEIPFFETAAGARIRGNLNSDVDFRGENGNYSGELRLWARDTVLNGIKITGMPLPDASYENIQGLYRVNGGKGTLESFTLQGRGLYVRLKGEIPFASPAGSAPLNLTLELMPKPNFLESQKFVFLLLTKYLTTPGHYAIPIRGTLAKPVIQ